MNKIQEIWEKWKILELKHKIFSVLIFILVLGGINENDILGWIPVLIVAYFVWNYSQYWKFWLLAISCFCISIIVLFVNFGILLHVTGLCSGGIGSGFSCNSNWMTSYASLPEIIALMMMFLGAPLWIWLIATYISNKNLTKVKKLSSNNLEVKVLYWSYLFSFISLLSILPFILFPIVFSVVKFIIY